ncbi:hypothetical protein DFQ26_003744 [Actinomortierella ambigua]|nr:hypothetical protein DFQ26_003744 [Actinomortierella ambigua]
MSSQHQKARWQTVGPHWNSVRPSPAGSTSSSPVAHHGFHSSYLNAISRPDLNPALNKDDDTLLPQRPTSPGSTSTAASAHDPCAVSSSSAGLTGVPPQILEHRRQQQLYLQQLELMQKLQTMPGSTTRLWYPTFGPTVTTTCSDSTILLDNPQQYTLNNSAKLNRHAVGPHWRSIQTYSPSSASLPSSPQPSNHSTTTAGASPSSMQALYASAASINQVRAASFCMHDGHAGQVMSEAARLTDGASATPTTAASASSVILGDASGAPAQGNYITGHYAGVVRYPNPGRDSLQYNHSHPHPTYPYYINTTPTYRERPELTALSIAMSRSTSHTSNASMESVSTALTSGGQSDKKRKAPWHDEDACEESVSEEQDLEHSHTDQEHLTMGGDGDGDLETPSVTQFVPVTLDATASHVQQLMDQDTDMISAPAASIFSEATGVQGARSPPRENHGVSHDIINSHAFRMGMDISSDHAKGSGRNLNSLKGRSSQERPLVVGSMDFSGGPGTLDDIERHARHLDSDGSIGLDDRPTDYDQSQSRPTVQPRRTRIRRESDKNDLASEARRQSGEVIRDIFQECFYNAAASSSR